MLVGLVVGLGSLVIVIIIILVRKFYTKKKDNDIKGQLDVMSKVDHIRLDTNEDTTLDDIQVGGTSEHLEDTNEDTTLDDIQVGSINEHV